MQALRISEGARRRLGPGVECAVHSVYRSTVNLMTPSGLVSLTNRSTPLHPFSVACATDSIESLALEAGQRAHCEEGSLVLPEGRLVSLGGAVVERLSAGPSEARPFFPGARSLFRECALPIARLSDPGFLIAPQLPTSLAPFREALIRFTRGFLEEDLVAVDQGSRQLAGLGRGLTPSFDDFCVGLLAASWRLGRREWISEAGPVLVANVRRASNAISAEFVAWAARGQFGENVVALARACGRDRRSAATALQKLLAMGHSSGADTAVGFLSAVGMFSSGRLLEGQGKEVSARREARCELRQRSQEAVSALQ